MYIHSYSARADLPDCSISLPVSETNRTIIICGNPLVAKINDLVTTIHIFTRIRNLKQSKNIG